MSIICQIEPVGGRRVIHAALAKRRKHANLIPSLRGAPQTMGPIATYRVRPRKGEAVADILSRSRRTGWLYPLIGGSCPGIAHLSRKAGSLRYSGITEGAFAQRLLDAALFAERHLPASNREFEARLLEIPTLQVNLLWLRELRGRNYFVSLSEGRAAPAFRLTQALKTLIGRAQRPPRKMRRTRA